MLYYPKGTKVTCVANGKTQKFELKVESTTNTIHEAILEKFEYYREESLCINGINVKYPHINSGYLIVEGKVADLLADEGKSTYFPFKEIKEIMKLGLRKGDIFHLKGLSSFTVNEVDYGNRCLCVELK